jgi:hypothetical protein
MKERMGMAGSETPRRDQPPAGDRPLATENPAMPEDETVSEFGQVGAKEREIALEAARDEESGGIAEQRAYLRREARIDEEERAERPGEGL